MQTTIQSLWIGQELSRVERLCVSSFLAHGHEFHLYTYGPVAHVPKGAKVFSAGEILDSKYIFLNSDTNTYSGFSNLFRYKLLRDRGGIWADMDLLCVKPFEFGDDYVICQEVDEDGSIIIASCVIGARKGSPLMSDLFEQALKVDRTSQPFGTLGPYFLASFVDRHASHAKKLPPEVFCPVPYTKWQAFISAEPADVAFVKNSISMETRAIHLWNEMWRAAAINKNARFPSSSFFETACSSFNI